MRLNYISIIFLGILGFLLAEYEIKINSFLFWYIIIVFSAVFNSVETLIKKYLKDN